LIVELKNLQNRGKIHQNHMKSWNRSKIVGFFTVLKDSWLYFSTHEADILSTYELSLFHFELLYELITWMLWIWGWWLWLIIL